jgi:hypothetical protein
MGKKGKQVHLARLAQLLGRRHEIAAPGRHVQMEAPDEDLLWLEEWQAERLAMTYSDLHAEDRYRPAVEFFLSDIYGAKDFSRRDDDIRRVYPVMARVLSEEAIGSITLAIDLHAMSQELDTEMVRVLREELGVERDLTAAAYGEAYRRVGRVADRRRQIELIVELGSVLDEVVPNPMLYSAVRLAHGPAHLMGFGELQDFVERGFVAFRHMRGADHFLDSVFQREMTIHRAIMDGADPEVWYQPPGHFEVMEIERPDALRRSSSDTGG